jgi:hypothetical protein
VNERVHRAKAGTVAAVRRAHTCVVVSAGALALGAVACGSSGKFANQPRPPAPITVTAAIDGTRVRVSPKTFGAGPVTIIVSNQSGASQQVTFETNEIGGTEGGIRASAGPVAPRGTTTLQVNPRRGIYRLSTKSRAVRPAAILVGRPRPSSQNELLQP